MNSLPLNNLPPTARELRMQGMPAPHDVKISADILQRVREPQLFRGALMEVAAGIGSILVPPVERLDSDRDNRTVPCMQIARAAIEHAQGEAALEHELSRLQPADGQPEILSASELQAQNLTVNVMADQSPYLAQR